MRAGLSAKSTKPVANWRFLIKLKIVKSWPVAVAAGVFAGEADPGIGQ
jgi:hypothetical protein